MTDPENEEEGGEYELTVVPAEAAVFEFDESYVVLPYGMAHFAATVNAIALHVESDGTIWGLDAASRQWINTELPTASGVTVIPGGTTRQ